MKRDGGRGLDRARESLVSSAGAVLIQRAGRLAGVGRELSVALAPWRSTRSVHDPGKVLLDVATAVALGGDCLADAAVVRERSSSRPAPTASHVDVASRPDRYQGRSVGPAATT